MADSKAVCLEFLSFGFWIYFDIGILAFGIKQTVPALAKSWTVLLGNIPF
jgi:hypothetical protein